MIVFHPYYNNNVTKWRTSIDSYNGDYATTKINTYLEKKSQREPEGAFTERKKVTEPMLHFSTAIDGLCGIMFNKDGDTSRDFGALGDIEDENSTAYALYNDADGEGTNWNSVFKQSAIKLALTHDIWGMVDGLKERVYNEGTQQEIREKTGDATIHLIDPVSVINWFPSTGALEEVIVKENFDFRESVDDAFPDDDVYVKYRLDGWERYRVITDDDGTKRKDIVSSGEYEFYRTKDKNEKILPIFKVEIPMPRNVGYLLSTKQKAMWNLESVRDFAVRAFSFAMLRVTVDGKDDKDKISNALKEGSNILWQYAKEGAPHDFISADSSWLSEAGNILKKKIEDFYHSAFKEYGDAARQRTATEIRLESQTGIEAFLTLLVDSVDEFEQQCLWRLEQIYFDSPSQWGQARVERSRDFTPEDTDLAMEKMMNRVFGERDTVPLPIESVVDVIKKWANQNGIVLPEDNQLQKAIEQRLDILPENAVGG